MIYNLDEVEFGGLFFLIVVFFLFCVCVKYGGGMWFFLNLLWMLGFLINFCYFYCMYFSDWWSVWID